MIKITSKWSEIDIAGSAVLTEAICNDLTFLWWVWLEKSVKFNIKKQSKKFFYVGGLPFESVVLSMAINWTSLSLNCSINWGWANDSKNSKSKSNALVSNFLVSRPSRPYWCVIAREQKKKSYFCGNPSKVATTLITYNPRIGWKYIKFVRSEINFFDLKPWPIFEQFSL